MERMVLGGATRICMVISPGKSDIVEYYGARPSGPRPCATSCSRRRSGLCDAIFRALPLIAPGRAGPGGPARHRLVPGGRPPPLPDGGPLLPAASRWRGPSCFDAVVTDDDGRVRGDPGQAPGAAASRWVWGAFKLDAARLFARSLRALVRARARGRVLRHAGERVAGARRRGARGACGRGLRGRGDRATAIARPCALAARGERRMSPAHARGDRGPGARARRLVSQPRSRRRQDRAGPFPRRLPGLQVAPLRPRHPGRPRAARPCSTSAATRASTPSR